jgi:1,4-alpha-glucan branching enzyme
MLFECAAESYLPLLQVFDRLVAEGISPKVTMGLTPILCEQLAHPEFPGAFTHYLDLRINSAAENREEFTRSGQPELAELAERWREHFLSIKQDFQERYGSDLVGQYRRLQDGGHLEIITSAATHGYLPLLGWDEAVQAQIKQAVRTHTRHFGRPPRGFWLPECAYRPRYAWASPLAEAGPQEPRPRKGVEEFLAENGITYFLVDTATLLGGATAGVYASRFGGLQRLWEQMRESYQPGLADVTRTPYQTYLVSSVESESRPVAVYTRDERTGLQVWSGEHG